jgi:primosomal protein N'
MYRWNLFLKSERAENINRMLKEVIGARRRESGIIITVDVDPY